jgi:hypothetical protein
MKYTVERLYADPEKAARCLMQHAHAFEPVQDGRINIEKSTARSCSATRRRRRNTRPASNARLRWAGWKFTIAELS